jgi:voltage-gated potassium channel
MIWLLRTYLHFFRAIHIGYTDKRTVSLMSVNVLLLSLATVVYMWAEGWSLLDALYFSVITEATIGFGDLVPQTRFGKIFTIAYVNIGVGIFVLTVGSLAEAILRAMRDLHEPDNREADQNSSDQNSTDQN